MVNFSESSFPKPSSPESGTDKDSKKTEKKKGESTTPSLFEQPGKAEKADKVTKNETLWKRVFGDEDKPEADTPKEEVASEDPQEGEIPLDELTESESKVVAIDHVEERQDEVRQEVVAAESGTPEAVEAAADALFLEKGAEHLAEPEASLQEALEAATRETGTVLEEYGRDEVTPPTAVTTERAVPLVEKPVEAEEPPEIPIKPEQRPTLQEQLEQYHATAPNVAPEQPAKTETYYVDNSSDVAGAAIGGGLVGYFLGRRRGRIKTERRLRPIQRKLEKQIEGVKEQVNDKETEIRAFAGEQYKIREDLQKSQPERVDPRKQEVITTGVEKQLLAVPLQVAAERAPEKYRAPGKLPLQKRVERMEQKELLEVGEKIIIDGTSARSIYEAKRITESGLRHLVGEYLSGGDLKRALARELVVKELSFERDPFLREGLDLAPNDDVTTALADIRGIKQPSMSPEQIAAQQQLMDASVAKKQQVPTSKRIAIGAWATLVIIMAVMAIILMTKN